MQRREKARLIIVVIVIAALIAAPFVLRWYWFFYYHGADEKTQAMLPAPPDCYVPPDVMVDGAAYATAQAWDDLNGDGVRSPGEPALQGVIIAMTFNGYPYSAKEPPADWGQLTDKNGQASVGEFRAGCACHCWEDRSVAAWAPSGYKATTATMIALSGDNQVVSFGFKRISP